MEHEHLFSFGVTCCHFVTIFEHCDLLKKTQYFGRTVLMDCVVFAFDVDPKKGRSLILFCKSFQKDNGPGIYCGRTVDLIHQEVI